jgi:hypothetical protein
MTDTPMLEATPEEYEKIKVSECVLVMQYTNDAGEVTRAYVKEVGTREECEDAEALASC